jgi:uncharacterized protein Yka (UPF0111/DUF47 family)
MTRFLPKNPDVVGLLVNQALVTVGGMAAFVAWAQGEAGADLDVRSAEHEADDRKRIFRKALVEAFVTPVSAEDLFILSARLDDVLGGAKDAVREAEVLDLKPDAASEAMVALLAEGTGHILSAFESIHNGRDKFREATEHAELAKKAARRVEPEYRNAMKALLSLNNMLEVTTRRDMYRRFSRIANDLTEVAERVWYVSVKEA